MLVVDVQYKPVAVVQLILPQRHGAVFDIVPSVPRQSYIGAVAHKLNVLLQYRPEAFVHPVSPQRHGAVFSVMPSVSRQSGAAIQRQLYQ